MNVINDRFSPRNEWPDLNYTIFFVLYMYEKMIGYLEPSFTFCKYNGDDWMRDGRVVVWRLGAGGK